MKVSYINNEGGGFADFIELNDGTTVGQFISAKFPDRAPNSLSIRVNREPTTADYVLKEGDRLSVTPAKIAGAIV
jgi:hypothetical protein